MSKKYLSVLLAGTILAAMLPAGYALAEELTAVDSPAEEIITEEAFVDEALDGVTELQEEAADAEENGLIEGIEAVEEVPASALTAEETAAGNESAGFSLIPPGPWDVTEVSKQMAGIKVAYKPEGSEVTEELTGWCSTKEVDYITETCLGSAASDRTTVFHLRLKSAEDGSYVDPRLPVPEGDYLIELCKHDPWQGLHSEPYETAEITVEAKKDLQELEVGGSPYETNLAVEETLVCKFVPKADGWYSFHLNWDKEESDDLIYCHMKLYDQAYKEVASTDAYNGLTVDGTPHHIIPAYLKKDQTYYYYVGNAFYNGGEGPYPIDKVSLQVTERPRIVDAKLNDTPSKLEFIIGKDRYINIDESITLVYSNEELVNVPADYWYDDVYGAEVDCMLYGDAEGKPDYTKEYSCYLGEDTDVPGPGIYWWCSEVTDVAPDSEERITIPVLVRVAVSTAEEHTHLWGEWTEKDDGTEVRECELCGETETRTAGSEQTPSTEPTETPSTEPAQTPSTEPAQTPSTEAPQTEAVPQVPSTSEVKVPSNNLEMRTNQSTTNFKVLDMPAGDSLVSVVSSNPKLVKVAKIKPDGTFKLKAKKKTGTIKLTITLASGATKTIKVKVQGTAVKTKKLKVEKALTLEVKKKAALEPEITPVTSQDKVTYKSSNPGVAAVNAKGVVTAKKAGTATITVQSGSKKATCKVTVKN